MRIFRRQETRSSNYYDLSNISFLGLNGVNYASFDKLENSDIFTAIHTISSDIASLPIVKKVDGTIDDNDNITRLLNKKPNQYYNGFQLKFILVANALLNGESFCEVVRDKNGKITALFHVKNSQIRYEQDRYGQLSYEVSNGNKTKKLESTDVLHFKVFSLDGIKGISPLKSLKYDLQTQQYSKKFLSNFFRNGTQNGGILTVKGAKLSPEAKENLKNEWQKANSGVDQAHKVVVLDETMEYQPIEVDTEVLKLINTSNFSTQQVAKVFKLPPNKMGLEVTNMSVADLKLDYLISTLQPYLESITNEIDFKLLNDMQLNRVKYEFNTSRLKEIDSETKIKVIKDKLSHGLISLNEARKEFGMTQLDDEMFNKHFINLNHITLDVLEQYQINKMKHNPITSKGGENDE